MEKIKCVLCNTDNYKTMLEVKDYRYHITAEDFNLVQCQNCGLVFINPRPSGEEIVKFYPRDYYPEGNIITNVVKYLFRKDKIRKIMRYKKSGKLLDVGCGDGDFLLGMSHEGFEVFGSDTSAEACKIAGQRLANKNKIYNSELRKCEFPEKYFDVITLSHVLEHLPGPVEELKEIGRILKDNGVVFLAMPNIDSIAFKIFGKYWMHLDIPRHLYHFSTATIRNMLEITGFKVIRMSYFSLGFPFSLFHSALSYIKDQDMPRPLQRFLFIIFIPFLSLLTFIFLILSFFRWSQDLEAYCAKNKKCTSTN